MPILTPTVLIDDDGSGTVGSVFNAAERLAFEANIQAALDTLDAGGTGLAAEEAARIAADALKAPLASPALTGTPTAPTAAPATNTTQLATTAFVAAESALKAALPGTDAPTTTGTETALALPAGTGDLVLYLNNATLLTIQGIAAGLSGQRLTLISKGAGQVDLAHQHASASAANRLINFSLVGNTPLAAGRGAATYCYDAAAARWRLITHEQGAWITPAYAAGDFTANGAMTWTVDAGDVGTYQYRLNGDTLTVQFAITLSSVGGTPNTSLLLKIPGGFVPLKAALGFVSYNDGAGPILWRGLATVGVATITFDKVGTTNWTVSTNTTNVQGYVEFQV